MKKKIQVIAEMACSHEGDPEIAKKIIKGAAYAGADAIQFQIWCLDKMVTPDHPDLRLLTRLEQSYDQWGMLAKYTREAFPGMEIVACVYEEESVDFANGLPVDAFKLHASDLSNPLLIRHVARTGKPVHLSVGASTVDEILNALTWVRETGNEDLTLMYGYQNFPTRVDDVHLSYLAKLKHLFDLPVGYQDHTDAETPGAFFLPAAAVGMGVDILEKHITHDRSLKGVDHEAALNPDEFSCFVKMLRDVEAAMGVDVPKPFSEDEKKYRVYSKKSIVAARDIAKGSLIMERDLTFRRAATLGIPPSDASRILGRTTRKAIPAMANILERDLE